MATIEESKDGDHHEEAEDGKEASKEEDGRTKSFTAIDVQKFRLEKLMKNIDKPVVIPDRGSGQRRSASVPDFVRNVMGSSAGAGSGEFHVYRHLRRKEFARQRGIEEDARRERLEDDYLGRLDKNRKEAEERTAKKRAKRLKKKQKGRKTKKGSGSAEGTKSSEDDEDTEEDKDAQLDQTSQAKETAVVTTS